MRSSIRSAVLGLLVLGGAAGIAGAQAPEAKQGKRGDRGGMMREGRGMGDVSRGLFRGITLSDAESAALADATRTTLDLVNSARERGRDK